jgi:hypothetical protein
MPKLSVWMIRTALLNMGIGFLIGALLLANKGVAHEPQIWRLLNPHVILLLFGWMTQLAMGVAFWVLPRFTSERRYGRENFGWASYVLFNSGVVVTAVAYWINATSTLIGYLLALCGVVSFAVMIWSRVKPLSGFTASQYENR